MQTLSLLNEKIITEFIQAQKKIPQVQTKIFQVQKKSHKCPVICTPQHQVALLSQFKASYA